VAPYVDLTLFDVTPSDLVDRALVAAETDLPEAALPVGSQEYILTEAIAVAVSEIAWAVNRQTGAVLESALTRLHGLPRSQGVAAAATVTFTFGAAGGQVPAGTIVQVSADGEDVQFATDTDLTVAAGTPTGTVDVTATELTDAVNGTAAGTPVTVLTATTGTTAAALASTVVGGAGPEDAEAYLDRGAARWQRFTSVLVNPDHFELAAVEDPSFGVVRVHAINDFDGAVTAAGHVTVAVTGTGGAALPGATKTALQTALSNAAHAALAVHVVDATITAVAVTITVKALPGYDAATVQANVVAALNAYLDPDTWGWGATVRRNELIAQADRAEGVDYVESLTTPNADVALPGAAPLADGGVIAVTVT
jgi:uncharacterized phage protein gp47/JayE